MAAKSKVSPKSKRGLTKSHQSATPAKRSNRIKSGAEKKETAFAPKWARSVLTHFNDNGELSILKIGEDRFFFQVDKILAQIAASFNGKTTLDFLVEKAAQKHKVDKIDLSFHVGQLIQELKSEKLIC